MNCTTPGLPVHHQLPEFTQTHVHQVSDAIHPSHPLSSPSPPVPNPSQHQSLPMSQLFPWGGQSIGVSASASVLPMNTQDWSPLRWTGWISLKSKGLSKIFSSTRVQKHQLFGAQLSSQSTSHIHTWPLEKPMWVNLESVTQSKVSQKERNKYHILTHICGIYKNGRDDPICKAQVGTQT